MYWDPRFTSRDQGLREIRVREINSKFVSYIEKKVETMISLREIKIFFFQTN